MDYTRLLWLQNLVFAIALLIAIVWETLAPAQRFPDASARGRHIVRNLGFFLASIVVASLLVGGPNLTFSSWATASGIGLLAFMHLPLIVLVPLGLLLTDLFDYLFHRLMHTHRLLWLVHCVHHSDITMDATTALRTHPGQSIAAVVWKALVALALGIPLWIVALHDLIAIALQVLHHANVRWPMALDRAVRLVLVTPAVHRAHHSPLPVRTNSNYGGVLTAWDRLLGTYCEPDDHCAEPVGLHALSGQSMQTLWGLLVTPWRARHLPEL